MAATGITVAIDGPAGAGKSTVAMRAAAELGYTLVDTGAIYRAVALLARRAGVAWDDDLALEAIVRGLRVSFRLEAGVNRVLVDGEEVTAAIRTAEISMGASTVSARPAVRSGLLELQRRLAGQGGAVLEGRDIGTVVCPQAPVKIFLDASPTERARRRFDELQRQGASPSFDDVLADMQRRDAQDRRRAVAPLRPAADALVLDSTSLDVDEVVRLVVAAARSAERACC